MYATSSACAEAAAEVSRATAYRYFPNRAKLVSAVIAEALGPVRRAVPQKGDAKGKG